MQPMTPSASQLKNIGNGLFAQERYGEALDLYTRASLAPGGNRLREVWSNKAAVLLALNEPNKALADAIRCRNVDRLWPKAYLRLAASYAALDSPSEALEACAIGLALATSSQCPSEEERSVKRALRRIQIAQELRLQESMFRTIPLREDCLKDGTTTTQNQVVGDDENEITGDEVKIPNIEITMDSIDELREIQDHPCWR